MTPADFTINWLNNQAAVGYTGLTASVTSPNTPNASFTLAGFTTAHLTDGKLSIGYGTTPNEPGLPGSSTYMQITST